MKGLGTLAKRAISPGSTFTNPIKGSALQDALNGNPKVTTVPNPTNLANKWVQTPNGPVQLGAYAGQGSFASVFKYGKASVIKLQQNESSDDGIRPRIDRGAIYRRGTSEWGGG